MRGGTRTPVTGDGTPVPAVPGNMAAVAAEARLSLCCRWWDQAFEIRGTDPEALRWIRSHLDCTLREIRREAVTTTVSVVHGRRSVAWLRSEATAPDALPVEGFAGEFWELTTGDQTLAWYRAHKPDDERLIVRTGDGWLVAATSREAACLTAVRVCREVLRARLASLGGVDVHASLAFRPGSGALLFVGRSGSGKTTMALAMAQEQGYVVSTDQTTLLWEEGRLFGIGSPVAHRLRAGTLGRLARPDRPPGIRLLREGTGAFDGNPPSDKTWITSLETEVLYGVPAAPAAAIDAVVFLTAIDGLTAPVGRRVSGERVRVGLEVEFRGGDPLRPRFWLTPEYEDAMPAIAPEDLVLLVSRVETGELCWDPTRHGVDESLACLSLMEW